MATAPVKRISHLGVKCKNELFRIFFEHWSNDEVVSIIEKITGQEKCDIFVSLDNEYLYKKRNEYDKVDFATLHMFFDHLPLMTIKDLEAALLTIDD